MSTFVSLENLQRLCTGVSEAVNTKFDTLNTQVNGLYFAQDDDGNWGYKTSESGDVTPFKLSTGTATAAEVLSGYTFSNSVSQNVSGTMTNRGNVSVTLNCGSSYTITAGYHGGGGTVTANSLASQTNATATAAQILNGYTAYVNGAKVTGNMTNQGAVTSTLDCDESYTIPAGYHDGTGTVTANSLSSQTNATATAARILNGYTAWVNGSKITGNMTNRGNVSSTLAAGGSYTIPAGYHGGGGKITASNLASQTSGNAAAAQILNGYTAWVNGSEITGSMNNWGSNTVTLSSSNTASLSAGYYSSVSINCASRYSNAYNAGKNAAASGVTRASIQSGVYTNKSGASNSVTFSSNATVYYTLSLFQNDDVDSVAYIQLNGSNKANSAFDYGQVLTTGSFAVTNGSVVYMYVYSGGKYGAVSYVAVPKA